MQVFIKGWSASQLFLLLVALLLSGCSASRSAFNKGEVALLAEDYDQAVISFLTAVQKDQHSHIYRMKLEYARERAALQHKSRGDVYLARQNYLKALEEYQLAVDLDGSLYVANEGAELAGRYLQAQKLTVDAEELLKTRRRLQAKDSLQKALLYVTDYQPALQLLEQIKSSRSTVIDGVELEVTSNQPITLNFNEAKLPDVFTILTKLSGINFILDEDVRGGNTTLALEKATFAQALELLLRMNKLDKKVLNSKTIILFPKSRDS
jgi:general secretion pathway protein D